MILVNNALYYHTLLPMLCSEGNNCLVHRLSQICEQGGRGGRQRRKPGQHCTCANFTHTHTKNLCVWILRFWLIYGKNEANICFPKLTKFLHHQWMILEKKQPLTYTLHVIVLLGSKYIDFIARRKTNKSIITGAHKLNSYLLAALSKLHFTFWSPRTFWE